jgi:hypothetical protein
LILGLADRTFAPDRVDVTPHPFVAGTVMSKPDIYYMVFDRYGGDETTRTLGWDNDIDDYLESKGFYVPGESRSNYIRTALSLASSLNAEYLDELARGRDGSTDWAPVYKHIERHRVGAFLRSQGYSYTHVGTMYYPTLDNPQATRNLHYYAVAPSSVTRLLDSGVLDPMHRALRSPWLDERLQNWHRTRRQIEDVVRLVPERGPKFVFLHIMVPHPPYIFDGDGGFVSKDRQSQRTFAQNYRNAVTAANGMIRQLVEAILRESASPGDHRAGRRRTVSAGHRRGQLPLAYRRHRAAAHAQRNSECLLSARRRFARPLSDDLAREFLPGRLQHVFRHQSPAATRPHVPARLQPPALPVGRHHGSGRSCRARWREALSRSRGWLE